VIIKHPVCICVAAPPGTGPGFPLLRGGGGGWKGDIAQQFAPLPPEGKRNGKTLLFSPGGTTIRSNPFAKPGSNPAVELGEGVGRRGVGGFNIWEFSRDCNSSSITFIVLDRRIRK
jgi:hypothetical protein